MPTNSGLTYHAGKLVLLLSMTLLAFSITGEVAKRIAAAGQTKGLRNPLARNPRAIKQGNSLFRAACGSCHGIDARGGGRGPDLTSGRWTHGGSDAALFRIITQGAPGTQMPANDLSAEETWMVIAYLRTLSATAAPPVAGNRAKGEKIFFEQGFCAQCHMVNGKGGRLGPELSRIGASRPVHFLTEAIREPSKHLSFGLHEPGKDFPLVYDTVTVLTGAGRRIIGIAKNEDSFSIQLMDQQEQLHFFSKKDLKGVTREQKSLMPVYTESMLSAAELQDLLAYLSSLRGQPEPKP